jgi:hypothetical protein
MMTEDDKFYEIALLEIKAKKPVASIYARALAEGGGDKNKTLSLYIDLRVKQLRQDRTISVSNNDNVTQNKEGSQVLPLDFDISQVEQVASHNEAVKIREVTGRENNNQNTETWRKFLSNTVDFFIYFIPIFAVVSSVGKGYGDTKLLLIALLISLIIDELIFVGFKNSIGRKIFNIPAFQESVDLGNSIARMVVKGGVIMASIISLGAVLSVAIPAFYSKNEQLNTVVSTETNTIPVDETEKAKEEHYNKIFSSHPDAVQIINEPEFEQWSTTQERQMVLEKGTADDVIQLLYDYKSHIANKEVLVSENSLRARAPAEERKLDPNVERHLRFYEKYGRYYNEICFKRVMTDEEMAACRNL